ncbi:MAG: TetR/AcrR family transcriptional regulator, partial [Pseudomonadota bacterium]
MQDVSDRAGVTAGAILYHFKNLETLLMEAFRADFEVLIDDSEPGSLADLSNDESVALMIGMLDDSTFRTRIGVLAEYLIAARNEPKRRRLVESVMRSNRANLVKAAEKMVGKQLDGERLWGIIDVAVSLLIAEQLHYPNKAQANQS